MQRSAAALTPLKKRSKDEFVSRNIQRDPIASGSILNSIEWRVVIHNFFALGTLLIMEVISPLRKGVVGTLARFRLESFHTYIIGVSAFLFIGNIIWTYISAIWNFYTQEHDLSCAKDVSTIKDQQNQTVPTPRSLLVSPRQKVNIQAGEFSSGYINGSSPPKASKSVLPTPPSLSVPWTPSTLKTSVSTQAVFSSNPYSNEPQAKGDGKDSPFIFSKSPLPNTGSQRVDQEVRSSIGGWTAKLMAAIKFEGNKQEGRKEMNTLDTSILPSRMDSKVAVKNITIVPAEKSFLRLGVEQDLEGILENFINWFLQKILRPLEKDIEAVTESFENAGLGHLGPSVPATYSLFYSHLSDTNFDEPSRNTISIPPTLSAGGLAGGKSFVGPNMRVQSLLELLSSPHKNDIIVQKRVRLERYLVFGGPSKRPFVIKRIQELAKQFSLSINFLGRQIDDGELLMHLFCTFMDERMPVSDYYTDQPFTQSHYVGDVLVKKPEGSSPTAALTSDPKSSVQIVKITKAMQTLLSLPESHQDNLPLTSQYGLIVEEKLFLVHPGAYNALHVLVCFVQAVARGSSSRPAGYLGLCNLSSPAIDLLSIFKVHF